MFRLLFSPLRMVRFGIRLAGIRNFTLLAIGVAIGLLIAPKPGAQFRQELAARLEERRGGAGGLSSTSSPSASTTTPSTTTPVAV